MKSRVVVILIAGAIVLAAGAGLFLFMRPAPSATAAAPPEPAPVESTPSEPPAPAPAPPTHTEPARPRPAPSRPAPAPPPAEAPPTSGTLHIDSDVADTSVFIDRVYLGTTPVTASNLSPGQHHLSMSAAGYDGLSEDIQVEVGTHDFTYKFKEIRLDEKLAVVHKHTFGSCSGTLVATPQGLTYDTTNKADAFSVPLTDLETFDVDYLNKNLRVKIKKGKTYNFADPDGNADRLYLFQRAVEKVRQRLLTDGRGGGQAAPRKYPAPRQFSAAPAAKVA